MRRTAVLFYVGLWTSLHRNKIETTSKLFLIRMADKLLFYDNICITTAEINTIVVKY